MFKMRFPVQQIATSLLSFHTSSKSQRQISKIAYSMATNISKRNYCTGGEEKQCLLTFGANKLEETLEKFLKSCEPLLTEEELKQTKSITEEFQCNEGKALQNLLTEVANSEKNWLAPRWLKTAYLQYRSPVTIYSSPAMVFPLTKFNTSDDYLNHTAKLILAMLYYKREIDEHKIPKQKLGDNELDNSQFYRVYGTCRIPQPIEDRLEYNKDSKHIVIIYKHHFFKLPVYNDECEILNIELLIEQLKKITASHPERGIPFGLLTHGQRDTWANAYDNLMKSCKNAESIAAIQKSLFVVCLDAYVSACSEHKLNTQSNQILHGGTVCENAGNRWMDKTIQLVVNPNGMAGFCYEHSPAEGQAIAQMSEYLINVLSDSCVQFDDGACEGFDEFQKLQFDQPDPTLEKQIKEAGDNIKKLTTNLEMDVLVFKKFGKDFIKKQKLSPDSFIQMAIQYAFYRMHKVPAAQYESAHLRLFYGGRTETIRSCSNESLAFVKAMVDSNCSDTQRVQLLRKAVEGHRKYASMAIHGFGVDRHLLGLKLMVIENCLPTPKFFQSPGFLKSTHFRISTSQVFSKYPSFMSYGPATEDGYSCCYNPRDTDMIMAIAAWRSCRDTCAQRFSKSLHEALVHMKQILEQASSSEQPKAKL